MIVLKGKKRKKAVRIPYWQGDSLVVTIPRWGKELLVGIYGGELLFLELVTTPGTSYDLPTLRVRKLADEGAVVRVRKIGNSMVITLPSRLRKQMLNLMDHQYVEIIEGGEGEYGDENPDTIFIRHNPAMDQELPPLEEKDLEGMTEKEVFERVMNRVKLSKLKLDARKRHRELRKMEGHKGITNIWYDPKAYGRDRGDRGGEGEE